GRIRRQEGLQDDRNSWGPEHHHLLRWLRQTTVDEGQARRWTQQHRRSRRQSLTAMKIDVIRSGEACLRVDPYGRVHSPLVNLRRVVRPALRIHGKALAEVDIASAQPLLTGYIAAKVATGEWPIEQVKDQGERARDDKTFRGYIPQERTEDKGSRKAR